MLSYKVVLYWLGIAYADRDEGIAKPLQTPRGLQSYLPCRSYTNVSDRVKNPMAKFYERYRGRAERNSLSGRSEAVYLAMAQKRFLGIAF